MNVDKIKLLKIGLYWRTCIRHTSTLKFKLERKKKEAKLSDFSNFFSRNLSLQQRHMRCYFVTLFIQLQLKSTVFTSAKAYYNSRTNDLSYISWMGTKRRKSVNSDMHQHQRKRPCLLCTWKCRPKKIFEYIWKAIQTDINKRTVFCGVNMFSIPLRERETGMK